MAPPLRGRGFFLDNSIKSFILFTMKRYTLTLLPNGFYRLWDYQCQWGSLYNQDGSRRHGNISIPHLRQIRSEEWLQQPDVKF
jgi:hypothetical protein